MLKVKNLSIWFNNHDKPTLENINFEANHGECNLITGSMGCGKSTFFWAISKLFSPGTLQRSNGSIDCDFPLILISQRIKSQILTFNVREELASRLSFQNIKREKRHQIVNELSNKYNLNHLVNRNTRKLSSGQQQLIVILANMIDNKEKFVILLDEPLSLLDEMNSKLVKSIIVNLLDRGNSVIIADPRPGRYIELKPTIYYLQNGHLEKGGESALNYFEFSFGISKYVTLERNIQFSMGIGYTSEIQRIEVSLPNHGIVLVTGENGSGKSTLLLTLAKIIKPFKLYTGEFSFPVALYLPQDTFSFFWRETVEDELLDSFNKIDFPSWLENLHDTSPFLLSEGQRKQLALDICYSHNRILLLDEPTQALDIDSIKLFIEKAISHAEKHLVVIATNDQELIRWFGQSPVVFNFS